MVQSSLFEKIGEEPFQKLEEKGGGNTFGLSCFFIGKGGTLMLIKDKMADF